MITGEREGYFTYFRRLPTGDLTNAGRIKAHGVNIQTDKNSWPYICDWTEDGKKDLLVGQSGIGAPCNVYVYQNEGTDSVPVFNDSTPVLFNGNPLTYWRTIPVLLDLDLDGLKDMILGGWYSDVRFYTNVGTNQNPVFENFIYLVEPDSEYYLNGNPPRVNFTDWDGDSDLDMITACYYGYVYLRENITGASVFENNDQVTKLSQLTITPNPATHRVLFKSWLAEPGFVQVNLYSAVGKLIASPFHRYAEAGELKFTWDIERIDRHKLPNGVYFVTLTAGAYVQTQKLLIMR